MKMTPVSWHQAVPRGVLVSVTHEDRAETVYNFEVEETHTYPVGDADVVVHNAEGYGMAEEASAVSLSRADAIKEGGSGFLNTLTEPKNVVLHGKFAPDEIRYYADNLTLPSGRDRSQAEAIVLNLNDLAGQGTHFELDEQGKVIVTENGNVSDEHPMAAKLLRGVLENEDMNLHISMRGDPVYDDKDLVGRGSRTTLARGDNTVFIRMDPNADAQARVWFEDDGTTFMSGIDDQPLALGHELIHAPHYMTGTNPGSDSTDYIVHMDASGNRAMVETKNEEIVSTGPRQGTIFGRSGVEYTNQPSFGHVMRNIFFPPISENALRAERGAPIRVTYSPVDKKAIIPLPGRGIE